MKKLWLVIALSVALLCGCTQEYPDRVDFSTAPTFPVEEITDYPVMELLDDGARTASVGELDIEGGTIEVEPDNDPNLSYDILMFREEVSGDTYPMCTLVNCSHDSPDCMAYTYQPEMHHDGQYLYLMEQDFYNDPENGYNNGYIVSRRNLDGSDQETILHLTDGGTTGVHGCLFRNDKIYYILSGSMVDEETHELQVGEWVCIGDLTTGKITRIPIDFNDGSRTGCLNLLGMHGNELILLHTTGNDGDDDLSDYHEFYFLLNVDTWEITIMLELWGGNRSYSQDPAAGYFYLIQDDGYEYWVGQDGIPVTNDPEIGHFTTNTGDRYFIDIPNRKVYKWSDVELFYKDGSRAGYWTYLKWDEGHASATRYARSIETGEEFLYNEIFN